MVRADTGRTQTDTLGLLSRENVRVNLEQNLGIKVPDQVKLKQVGLGVVTAFMFHYSQKHVRYT